MSVSRAILVASVTVASIVVAALAWAAIPAKAQDRAAGTAAATSPATAPATGPAGKPSTRPAARRPAATSPASAPSRGTEVAQRRTLQEYIDRYSGDHPGCTIGGQTFRHFKVLARSSIDSAKLKGEHPSPPLRADQIFLTPVNYVKDGVRWVGFRFTTAPDMFEVRGGPHKSADFEHIKGHDIQNCGFTSNYDIRFEVHGTTAWQRGKVAYANMFTERLVEDKWTEEGNTGPGSRGNLGWFPRKIGENGGYGGNNPKTPTSGGMARLSSVSHSFSAGAKAPRSNENWFEFSRDSAPMSFEIRQGYWPEYGPGREPVLGAYGIWFRLNCWGQVNTRWRADYIEYSFANEGATDEVWTSKGIVKAPASGPAHPKVELADAQPPKASGQTLELDLGDGVKMKFVEIPAGKFVMGSASDEKGRCDDEGPPRIVTISKPYYMAVCEVTQEQFRAIGGKEAVKPTELNKPLGQLSHTTAKDFCKKLSAKTGKTLRLPTEAEWEYAARAGKPGRYEFGDDEKQLGDFGWFFSNSERGAHEVAQKKPNAWGLYDMYGNVWEWCSDWYAPSYDTKDVTDPKGPADGEVPVLRGGSWSYPAAYCRSAARLLGSPNDIASTGTIGFRLVCEKE